MIIKKFFRLSNILILISINSLVSSQLQLTNSLLSLPGVPPAPQAAGLINHMENPVDLFTGNPDISIPLFDVKVPGINLPVSISYSTSNIKLNDIPGNTGFGWSLLAGGFISAVFNGLPDAYTFKNNGVRTIDSISQAYHVNPPYWVDNVIAGSKDVEPDMFFFSFPGGSGKFVLKNDGTPMLVTPSLLRISFEMGYNGYVSNDFLEWKIIDDKGYIYYFGEVSSSDVRANAMTLFSHGDSPSNQFYSNTWYLTRIETPSGDWIKLNYDDTHNGQNGIINYSPYFFSNRYLCLNDETPSKLGDNDINRNTPVPQIDKRLISICSSLGEVTSFNVEYPSCDSKLFLFSSISTPLSDIYFNYGLFNNDKSGNRPKLESLIVNPKFGLDSGYAYSFNYKDDIALPARVSSYAIDLWGYYNGRDDNSTLIPSMKLFNRQNPWFTNLNGDLLELSGWGHIDAYCWNVEFWSFPGADRQANANKITSGVLESITLPTGGKKYFVFEPHDFSHVDKKKVILSDRQLEYIFSLTSFEEFERDSIFYIPDVTNIIIKQHYYTHNTPAINLPAAARPYLKIIKDGTETVYSEIMPAIEGTDYQGTIKLELTPGSYTLRTRGALLVANSFSMSTAYEQHWTEPVYKSYGGGLRIKEIGLIEQSDTLITRYHYNQPIDSTRSSGVMIGYPNHIRVVDPPSYVDLLGNCTFLVETSSNSINQLNSLQGSNVVYNNVEVEHANYAGKVITSFTSPINRILDSLLHVNIPDDTTLVLPFSLKNKFPFSPFINDKFVDEVMYGKPLSERTINNNAEIVREGIYKYDSYSQLNPDTVIGLKIAKDDGRYRYKLYYIIQNEFPLYSDEVWDYPIGGTPGINQKTNYYYDSPRHFYLTRSIHEQSDGSKLLTKKRYPIDFDTLTCGWISSMKSMNNLSTPLVNYEYSFDMDSARIINGKMLEFNENGFPQSVYRYIGSTSVDDTLWNVNLTTWDVPEDFILDSEILDYSSGVIRQNEFKSFNNPKECLIWGYSNSSKVIAHCRNAQRSEIFHENFENQNNFVTNIPASYSFDPGTKRTGKKSLKISKAGTGEAYVFMPFLDIDNNEAKKYKYSVWVYSDNPSYDLYFFRKTQNDGDTSGYSMPAHYVTSNVTNKWVYLEGEVEVTSDNKCLFLRVDNNGGGNVWFDDLRLHPADAQMTTYTYDPLVGMTSQTDPNGQTTYYEYDGMGRLVRIRDHEHNLLQEYKYNYATQ